MTPAKKRIRERADERRTARIAVRLDKLPPAQRERVERALHPRDTAITTRHRVDDVVAWKRAARVAKVGFVDWVEAALNKAAGR